LKKTIELILSAEVERLSKHKLVLVKFPEFPTVAFSDKHYDKMVKEHGENWVLIEGLIHWGYAPYRGVTEAFIRHYKSSPEATYDYDGDPVLKNSYLDVRELIEQGKLHQVVRLCESGNGLIYDIKGKQVPRAMCFDYIATGHITGHMKKHEVDDFAKKLREHPFIRSVEVIEIPYYNRDHYDSGHGIEFKYEPPPCVFWNLHEKISDPLDDKKEFWFEQDSLALELIKKEIGFKG
jgi:hypothetical protein